MIRIGHNPNTNMLPMFYFLPREHPLLESVTAEPTGHNAMLADGRIDMAPISAFSYGEHWRDYAILPNLSVSTRGRVGSILLFSKVPLTDLNGFDSCLDGYLGDFCKSDKDFASSLLRSSSPLSDHASDLQGMFAKADAALLIADAAIQASLQHPDCYIYDLGEEWFQHTGCSMTYAVWAFPKKLITERRRTTNCLSFAY